MNKEIYFYTRNACHLCEEAKSILLDLQDELNFTIREFDIDEDDALTEKYGLMIPVIEFNGEILQYGKIIKEMLRNDLLYKNMMSNS